MRVVFMGTPAFAVPSLDSLLSAHDVVGVVTRPDGVAGRGGARRPSEVKLRAEAAGVALLQPTSLRGEATAWVAALRPDVVCVAAFGMLLPAETLAVPQHGCINVHASLLPRYRGAAPIQRAILAGDAVTGVSIMRMEEGLDTGPYALQREVLLDDRYAAEVETEIARVGGDALLQVLGWLEDGTVVWTRQDDAAACYAPKITKDDVALEPDLSVADAFRRVRAATTRAPARACLGDREVTVVRARPTTGTIPPGTVGVDDGLPVLGFTDGALALEVVRPSGRPDMSGADWLRGARITGSTCWRCTR